MRRDRSHSSGFTLLEVVVALAILGVGVVILLESHYGTMTLFVSAQDAAIEELVIGQAVAHAEQSVLSGKDNGEGELGAALEGYTYTFTASMQDEIETPGLYEVTVNVAGPNLDRSLRYLVYDGAQTDVGK